MVNRIQSASSETRGHSEAGLATGELLRLGTSPRPTTDRDLELRVLDALRAGADSEPGTVVRGIESVAVEAKLRGADIAALRINATGLDVIDSEVAGSVEAPAPTPASAEVRNREPAMLRKATFAASPLRIQGVSVEVDAQAVKVPIEWLDLDDGGLAVAPREPDTPSSRRAARFQIRLAANPDEVLTAIMATARQGLVDLEGIRVDREKLSITQLGPRRIRFSGSVRVRWKLLRPTVRASLLLHVDSQFVARLRLTRLSSSNLLLAVVLRVLRGRANRELAKPIDLNEHLGTIALRTLRMNVGKKTMQVEVGAGFA